MNKHIYFSKVLKVQVYQYSSLALESYLLTISENLQELKMSMEMQSEDYSELVLIENFKRLSYLFFKNYLLKFP